MITAISAIVLFVLVIVGVAVFFAKMGGLSFWKLAAELPEEALHWCSDDPAWVVLNGKQSPPGKEFVGPFILWIPSLGQRVTLYARADCVEESQKHFVDHYRERIPPRAFPVMSTLALLYPVGAMLSMAATPASLISVLGYGFANLGYLLAAAFLVPGHFRILGLDNRITTILAGIIFWVLGFALSNLARG